MPPPPPPPPPPLCLPFTRKSKAKQQALFLDEKSSLRSRPSQASQSASGYPSHASRSLHRSASYSPTATVTDATPSRLALARAPDSFSHSSFHSHPRPRAGAGGGDDKLALTEDTESYAVPAHLPTLDRTHSKLSRRPTAPTAPIAPGGLLALRNWGYGWGIGRTKEKEKEALLAMVVAAPRSSSETMLPVYGADALPPLPVPPPRERERVAAPPPPPQPTQAQAPTRHVSQRSKVSQGSKDSKDSKASKDSKDSKASQGTKASKVSRWPSFQDSDAASTLVGSALERKEGYVDPIREVEDTRERLDELRKLMAKDGLDYYVIPSEDAHQSEYVSAGDKRREWISQFTGSAGQAIVSKSNAYLITDSRYWLQARGELDDNWILIPAGAPDGPADWIEWLVDRAQDSKIGLDARMVAHEKAAALQARLAPKNARLAFPPQNLVDLLWKGRPARSKSPVYVQPIEYTGKDAARKLAEIRDWLAALPPSVPSYSKAPPTAAQRQTGTLITSLQSIAYTLNLRGDDIPYNPLFFAYLYVSAARAVLFVELAKIERPVGEYLQKLGVETRDYNDIWAFVRRREWGEGKVVISPQTSYALSLMLTHFRFTVLPPVVDALRAVKTEVEIQGLKRAHLRDGACFVRMLAWLEERLAGGYAVSEWEAANRLAEYRRKAKNFMMLAYENISASGPNASLPHYSPLKDGCRLIDKDTPYLNDSGGNYRDGTCDTTRTTHFGRPTEEQCEAYTRVLQGHIAIDSAIFPQGTTGRQLDVLARRALWQEGLNYMHGTGHGVGSFLSVHEGPHSFSNDVELVPGHVITNEPGFYNPNQWGVRIESALVVRHVQTKREFNGPIWLGFERLTCVPISTRMVDEGMLTKEEKTWLKDHNKNCLNQLEPLLREDKRALKWLQREVARPIGPQPIGPIGLRIDWE